MLLPGNQTQGRSGSQKQGGETAGPSCGPKEGRRRTDRWALPPSPEASNSDSTLSGVCGCVCVCAWVCDHDWFGLGKGKF